MDSTQPLVDITVTPEIAAASMRNWNHALRSGHNQMKAIFSLYEGFSIDPNTLPPGGDDFHVYPGLDSQADTAQLEFFVIHSQYDNPIDVNVPGRIVRYPGRLIRKDPAAYIPIPDDEGVRRIFNWTLNNQNWLDGMFDQQRAMFQCWHVPFEDLDRTEGEYKLTFGLVVSANASQPDLIIQHVGRTPNFYDLVRPVPPFKSGEMTEYHLLMTALR